MEAGFFCDKNNGRGTVYPLILHEPEGHYDRSAGYNLLTKQE
jgi:hypothetical protein